MRNVKNEKKTRSIKIDDSKTFISLEKLNKRNTAFTVKKYFGFRKTTKNQLSCL